MGILKKMGGDHRLDDESRSEDSETYSDSEYTKEGYLKDDFCGGIKRRIIRLKIGVQYGFVLRGIAIA